VVAAVAALAVGGWMGAGGLAWWGGAVPVRAGLWAPSLTVDGVFFRPGSALQAPVAGRVLALAPGGAVPAGAPLVSLAPAPARALARPEPPAAAARLLARWRRRLARWWCIQSRCGPAAPGPGGSPSRRQAAAPSRGRGGGAVAWLRPRGPQAPPWRAVAAAPAWFTPAWNALATLPAAGYAGVTPTELRLTPWVRTRPGEGVAAGAPLGVLGDRWTGVWLVLVPEPEADALADAGLGGFGPPAAVARMAWPGHAPVPVVAEAAGPPLAGWRVLAFASDRLGAGPPPPGRGAFTLLLPPRRGALVPRAALRWASGSGVSPRPPAVADAARAEVAVWHGGGARWVAVRTLAASRAWALVLGLRPGALVLTRPGWVAPWIAGGGESVGEVVRHAARA
jgi:hypothetical protein